MDTSGIGRRTEGMVLSALLQAGYEVLLPFGAAARYDLACDVNGRLMRIQCKTGTLQDGAVVFKTANWNRKGERLNYRGQVDFFGVHCPQTAKIYLVPVEDVGELEGRLRVEPTRNMQNRRIRWDEGYEL